MKKILIIFILIKQTLFALKDNNQSEEIINNKLSNEITSQVNQIILNNIENINSTIANHLQVLEISLAFASILLVALGFMNFTYKKQLIREMEKHKKQIKIEIEERTEQLINKKFRQEAEDTREEIYHKLSTYVKTSIRKLKKESQKEEFLRNLIFKDLNTILSSELSNHTNISEVFNTYANRCFIISQLTSGNDHERKIALRKLSIGSYKQITKLESFKEYLKLLKKTDTSLDIANAIVELESALKT